MAALDTGKQAPEVSLPLAGGGKFDLRSALKNGPVLLAFFKISCPVCQLTFPYLERIHKQAGKSKLKIVGVSQDDEKASQGFAKEYGVTFPIALDDTSKYPVSNAYGLTNVPTLFLVGQDGKIEMSSVGWAKTDVQSVADSAAKQASMPAFAVFEQTENVPAFKPG